MLNIFTRSHGLTKTASKWFSVLLGIVCILCWVALLLGNLKMDIELDGGFALNAYLVVGLAAATVVLVFYCLVFVAIYSSFFIVSKIKSK